jgi:hypothetical protein
MYDILLLLVAGLGAGIVTGVFGGSNTLVTVPLLVIFGGYHPFVAVGIGLASDVFTSAVGYFVYRRNKHVEIGPALPLLAMALAGVALGTVVSTTIPAGDITLLAGMGNVLAGIIFIQGRKGMKELRTWKRTPLSAILGFVAGFVLGTWGAGGGVAILLVLTLVLGYPAHKAVGTSLFIMTFAALFGGAGHYALMPFDTFALAVCAAGSIAGAFVSSVVANRMSEARFRVLVGACIVVSGAALFVKALSLM